LKIRYTCTYECREHGVFSKKSMHDIHETVECPKCHRISELVEGTFVRVAEHKRIITKTQKKLEVI
jgi:hypothetical protein